MRELLTQERRGNHQLGFNGKQQRRTEQPEGGDMIRNYIPGNAGRLARIVAMGKLVGKKQGRKGCIL